MPIYLMFVCTCNHICEVIDLSVCVWVLHQNTTHMARREIKVPVVLDYNFHSKVAGPGLNYSDGLRVTARVHQEDVPCCVLGLPDE